MWSYSDPRYRHPTQRETRAGVWECRFCESCNDPDMDKCFNCEKPRENI